MDTALKRAWGATALMIVSALLLELHATQPAPTEAAKASTATYSPFTVRVAGELPFEVLSFKDVGIAAAAGGQEAWLYELMSEELASALNASPALHARASSRYEPAAADPAQHLACEREHIYVDVWSDAKATQWGYSLWSGCGHDSRFAWEEVPVPPALGRDARVAPLAREIAAALSDAVRSDCFTQHC